METIHQTVVFDCPAHAFYETFLDEDQHAEIIGSTANIQPYPGGNYQAFEDESQGEFTRLVPDRLIVMRWRSAMEGWPEDHFAVISMELFQSSDGTTVEFEMSDVPGELAPAVEEGWENLLWAPFLRHFAW